MAEQEKNGAIGEAAANRERTIRVAENMAESEKGQKKAEADRRIYVRQQETLAAVGEVEADREKTIRTAENTAQAEKGQKKAEADKRVFVQQQEAEAVKGEKKAEAEQRIYVQEQEALAVTGENKAKADIADAEAVLAMRQAEALQKGEVAKRQAEVEIQKAQYLAEQQRLNAEEVVRQEIEKQKIEIDAEADGREDSAARPRARPTRFWPSTRPRPRVSGRCWRARPTGYESLVKSCNGDAKAASTLLMIEKIEEIVGKQVEAIKNLKIDKITVWDSGSGGTAVSTANFLSSMIKVPPAAAGCGAHGRRGIAGLPGQDGGQRIPRNRVRGMRVGVSEMNIQAVHELPDRTEDRDGIEDEGPEGAVRIIAGGVSPRYLLPALRLAPKGRQNQSPSRNRGSNAIRCFTRSFSSSSRKLNFL